jgi:hypothetical protein
MATGPCTAPTLTEMTARPLVRLSVQAWKVRFSLSLSLCVWCVCVCACVMPNFKNTHLTELFYKYGVDVIIEAHEHSYERLWPVYNETVKYPSAFLLSTNSRESVRPNPKLAL